MMVVVVDHPLLLPDHLGVHERALARRPVQAAADAAHRRRRAPADRAPGAARAAAAHALPGVKAHAGGLGGRGGRSSLRLIRRLY